MIKLKESIWPRGMLRNDKRNMRILILDSNVSENFRSAEYINFASAPKLAPFVPELWLPKEIEVTFYVPTKKRVLKVKRLLIKTDIYTIIGT